MNVTYESDPFRSTEERPKAEVLRFGDLEMRTQRESETGRNFDHSAWEYDFGSSKWFDAGELVRLEPGEYTDFRPPGVNEDDPVERCLRIVSGRAVLRTERRDVQLERFDLVTVPDGAAHQIGNVGTETLWFASWTSTAGEGVADRTAGERSDDAIEEYDRIMAARKAAGLSAFPDYDGEYDGDLEEGRPEPTVTRFAETIPKVFHEAPEVGCTADRPDWVTTIGDLERFSDSVVVKLEPGDYISLHTHFENEGPHEEIYWIVEGEARLLTEYRDETLTQFDCAFFPTGNPHSVGNVGTDTLWIAAWGARGGIDGEFDLGDLEVSERPGQAEEYERVMAARKKRGLPLPHGVTVDLQE